MDRTSSHPRPTTTARLRLLAGIIATLSATLTSCAAPSPSNAAPAKSTAPAGFPVEVENCGRTLTFESPPQRVVSGWPTNSEALVALGADKRVVGTYNTANASVGEKYAAAVAAMPELSAQQPNLETLLTARPDLVWADGSYAFDGKTLPKISTLAGDGIPVLILSGFCTDDASAATVADVRTDITLLGRVLGAPQQAERLLADVDQRLAAVHERVAGHEPVPVAMLSSYDGALYTYEGVYSDMARLAGASNIYAGTLPKGTYFGQVSAEDVLVRDPATIVYLATSEETPDAARQVLAEALPGSSAVRDGNIAVIQQSDSTNLAAVRGTEELAQALHP